MAVVNGDKTSQISVSPTTFELTASATMEINISDSVLNGSIYCLIAFDLHFIITVIYKHIFHSEREREKCVFSSSSEANIPPLPTLIYLILFS